MKGLVIKQADTTEGNRIVWIITSEYGVIKASGRGALKVRGKNGAGSQFLTYAEFELFQGKELHNINSAEPIESFIPIHESITKLALASYFCEAVYRHMGLNNPDNDIYRLLLNCIHTLAYKDFPEKAVKAVFEARFTADIGYRPVLDCCIECGDMHSQKAFDIEKGGILCGSCAKGDTLISKSAINAWRYICDCDAGKIFSFEADDECIGILEKVTEKYLEFHSGIQLKSLDYYKTVKLH